MSENGERPGVHDHEHSNAPLWRLVAAAVLNTGFGVVQIIVGLAIGSVVVLADAAHQAVDALGLITALIAVVVARRPASDHWTYGFGKADALGGFVSSLLLIGSIVWIVYESIGRLVTPEEVSGLGVLLIGVAAVGVNAVGVALVGGGHGDEAVSMRAARLHLLTDLAGSFLVVAAGALILAGGPEWIDPAASLALSAAVLWSTWTLIRSATGILLDRVPRDLSVPALQERLEAEPGVARVHHLHLRPLGGGRTSVSAHVIVGDCSELVHDAQGTLTVLNSILRSEYGVAHTTLQLECHACADETCTGEMSGAKS